MRGPVQMPEAATNLRHVEIVTRFEIILRMRRQKHKFRATWEKMKWQAQSLIR
jgi:hypothetical protein